MDSVHSVDDQPHPDVAPEAWEQRFRAARVSLPEWATEAPARCLFASNASGTVELYTWDRDTDEQRQATDRSNGTIHGELDPAGEQLWWFADTDGDEFGVWMRQPFAGGPDTAAVPGLKPSYPAGLALGHRLAIVGRSTDDGASIHLAPRAGGGSQVIYAHREDAHLGGLSRDESVVCVAHSEGGNTLKPALRVLRLTDPATGATASVTTVADLDDGPELGLWPVDFAPVDADTRLLAVHEREGVRRPLVWDPVTGTEHRIALDLPGDVDVDWYPDGQALLVQATHRGRDTLYRYDLITGGLHTLPTPPGTVGAATARPDGSVEFTWSSAARPSQVRSTTGEVVLRPPGPPAPESVEVADVDASGPGGPVHGLLARPTRGAAPYPAVFLVHGGPMHHDADAFAADRAAWVDAGFAVVHVNYRGSTGYGMAWQDAIHGRPGRTELEDVEAIRRELVTRGVVDPARLVVSGGSWGGYLTLLALGTSPDAWAAGVAAVPVADYVAAYDDEMDGLKATDRALFGGSPTEVPQRYRDSSPITYVEQVRAPVLVLAGANDPRCPIRQIENYLGELRRLGTPFEVYRYDAGHGSLVVEERIRQMRAEIDFVRRRLPSRRD